MAVSLKEKFKKNNAKSRTISTDDPTPDFYLSTGNKLLNKIISGRYDRGWAQGRIGGLSGLSGAGKSFLIASAIAQAQKENYFVLVIDSENALDTDFLTAAGVDCSEDNDNYLHVSVSTLGAAADAISQITEDWHEARSAGKSDEMQKLLIIVDSLDFLFTDSMMKKWEDDGEMGNDQGLHARKMKQLLQTMVADIKFLPAIAICTKQVYVDQTPNANPPVKMSEAAKFALTQLLLLNRIMTKDEKVKGEKFVTYNGIELRAFAWKTRGCKPFQRCEIVIPYDEGMDEYEGLLQVAVKAGIVEASGAWFNFNGQKWQGKDAWRGLDVSIKEAIFQEIVKQDIKDINIAEGEDELDVELKGGKKSKKSTVADAADAIKKRKAAKAAEDAEAVEDGEAGE